MPKLDPLTTWHPGRKPPINGDVVLGYTPGRAVKFTVAYHDGHYWRSNFSAGTTVQVEKWIEIPEGWR